MIQDFISLDQVDKITRDANGLIGTDRDVLKNMLLTTLFIEDKFMMVDIEGEIKAFMFATVEILDGEHVAFIHICYSKKSGAVDEMLRHLNKWASKRGIKRIIFMTKRNPRAFEKRYGFNDIYTVMEKKVG